MYKWVNDSLIGIRDVFKVLWIGIEAGVICFRELVVMMWWVRLAWHIWVIRIIVARCVWRAGPIIRNWLFLIVILIGGWWINVYNFFRFFLSLCLTFLLGWWLVVFSFLLRCFLFILFLRRIGFFLSFCGLLSFGLSSFCLCFCFWCWWLHHNLCFLVEFPCFVQYLLWFCLSWYCDFAGWKICLYIHNTYKTKQMDVEYKIENSKK